MKTGKLLLWVLFLLTGLSFASCDKDDDGANAKIVGTWVNDSNPEEIGTFVFKSNGTFTFTWHMEGVEDDVDQGTYTFDDPNVTLFIDEWRDEDGNLSDEGIQHGYVSGNVFYFYTGDTEPYALYYKR